MGVVIIAYAGLSNLNPGPLTRVDPVLYCTDWKDQQV